MKEFKKHGLSLDMIYTTDEKGEHYPVKTEAKFYNNADSSFEDFLSGIIFKFLRIIPDLFVNNIDRGFCYVTM